VSADWLTKAEYGRVLALARSAGGRLALLAIAVSGSGCLAPLTMPATRFMTPETRGGPGRGFAGAGYASSPTTTVVDVLQTPVTAGDRIDSGSLVSGHLVFGILERVDLQLVANGADLAPTVLRGQVQLLGATAGERATGPVLSVMIGVGAGKSSSQTTTFNGPPTTVDAAVRLIEGGAIAGYRVDPRLVAYSGLFASRYSIASTIRRTAAGSASTSSMDGTARQFGLTFGLEADLAALVVRAEAAASRSTAPSGSRVWMRNFGVQAGVRW
jgi:hypothetical protein